VQGGKAGARGAKAVDFEQQGTCEDGEFTIVRKGSPFQIRIFFPLSKNTLAWIYCICVQIKKEFSVQVKKKPCVGIRTMHLFLVHQSSW
jgi:hypothetical protein